MPERDYRDSLLRPPAPAPLDLAAIRARRAAITAPPPWHAETDDLGLDGYIYDAAGNTVCGGERNEGYLHPLDPNVQFIAAAPADIAALLAEVERLRALIDTRRARYAGKRDYAADQLAYPTGNERDYAFWSGYREACQDMLDEEQP